MKKLVALMLALVMVLSMAACGAAKDPETPATNAPANQETPEKPETPETKPAEDVVISVFGMTSKTYLLADNLAWNYGIEKAGINVELTEVIPAEYQEKANLLLNSGEYPDVFWKCNYLDCNSYGMQGIFIPLEDLIREHAPNLTKRLDEYEGWDDITAADGHIYALPSFDGQKNCVIGTTGPQWINKGWLDNLGLAVPTNMDELYEVLKAFKEKDANGNGDPNDEIPYIHCGGTNSTLASLSLMTDDALLNSNYSGLVDGKFVYYPVTESYKDLLAYAAKLYSEGLMHTDSLIMTSDQRQAITKAGDMVGMFHSSSPIVPDEFQLNMIALPAFNEAGYPLNTGINANGLAITDACEDPAAVLKWMDFFYSDEGGLVSAMGLEGECYQINEDGSYTLFNDKFESRVFQTTLLGYGVYPCITPAYFLNGANPKDNPLSAHSSSQIAQVLPSGTSLPALIFTEEENETLGILSADITPYVENYTAQVISGQLSLEESWDDYMKTLEEMRVDELQTIYQAAYARATAN